MGTAIYRDPALPLLRLSNGVDSGPGVFILLAVLPAALSHVRLTFVDQRRRRVSWCSARTEASRPSVREPGIWWTSYAVSTLYASSGPGSCIFLVSTSTSLVDVTVDFAGAPLAVELARPHPPPRSAWIPAKSYPLRTRPHRRASRASPWRQHLHHA